MKFHCEYCRELVDTEKDKKCPSCGATYKENKEYKKLLEEQEQQKKLIKEQQDFVHKQVKRIGIAGGVFVIIVPIIILSIMALVIYVGIKNSKKMDKEYNDTFKKMEEKINTATGKEDKTKEEVKSVIVNEEKISKDYKVKFDNYKLIEQKNDKEFDKLEVNLVIEIISDNFMASGENIYCLVNNVSQNYDFSGSDTFNYIKDKNVPTSKKMTYYVPKELKSFDIKYGNEVSFHVDIKND